MIGYQEDTEEYSHTETIAPFSDLFDDSEALLDGHNSNQYSVVIKNRSHILLTIDFLTAVLPFRQISRDLYQTEECSGLTPIGMCPQFNHLEVRAAPTRCQPSRSVWALWENINGLSCPRLFSSQKYVVPLYIYSPAPREAWRRQFKYLCCPFVWSAYRVWSYLTGAQCSMAFCAHLGKISSLVCRRKARRRRQVPFFVWTHGSITLTSMLLFELDVVLFSLTFFFRMLTVNLANKTFKTQLASLVYYFPWHQNLPADIQTIATNASDSRLMSKGDIDMYFYTSLVAIFERHHGWILPVFLQRTFLLW